MADHEVEFSPSASRSPSPGRSGRASPAPSAPESDRPASRRDRSGAEADRPPAAFLRPAKETSEHARDHHRRGKNQ
eukprot:7234701-Alexandrium_andersonii.AAC.1